MEYAVGLLLLEVNHRPEDLLKDLQFIARKTNSLNVDSYLIVHVVKWQYTLLSVAV